MNTTVAGVARAIRKNGWEQAFHTWGDDFSGKACALGQAAKNLGLGDFGRGQELASALNAYKNADGVGLGDYIVGLNDNKRLTLDKIARQIEKIWEDFLDEPVRV